MCASLTELIREIEAGADAILLTDAMLGRGDPDRLAAVLHDQPPGPICR